MQYFIQLELLLTVFHHIFPVHTALLIIIKNIEFNFVHVNCCYIKNFNIIQPIEACDVLCSWSRPANFSGTQPIFRVKRCGMGTRLASYPVLTPNMLLLRINILHKIHCVVNFNHWPFHSPLSLRGDCISQSICE